MNKPNDERNTEPAPQPASPPGSSLSQGLRFKLAALGLTVVSALFAAGMAYWFKPSTPPGPSSPETAKAISIQQLDKWDKPDFVVLLSGQQHGYLLPCGCSFPQVGGLERRYNFLQTLKARGWPVVAVDLGDVPQKKGPAGLPNVQGLLKYNYSLKALKDMNYLAVGMGEYEAALSLGTIEGNWAANEETPALLVANLDNPANFPFLKSLAVQTVAGTNLKVGVTSVVGPTVAAAIKDPAVKFKRDTSAVLNEQLKAMQAQSVDLPLLLYHGTASPRPDDGEKEAIRCAEAFPQFPVILCLSEEDEPPIKPTEVRNPQSGAMSYVIRLGHKGKYVGVLGVYRNPQGNPPFTFKYQTVEMVEEYTTPKGQEGNNPILKKMEDYTRDLQKGDYLEKYALRQRNHLLQVLPAVQGLRYPLGGMPTYIGSEACKKCHEEAYEVWKKSDHSHAYQTLVKATRPSLRQYDGECIVCHTVGFGYKSGFTDATKTPHLENVGCENCHGPGSLHAKNPQNEEWRQRMSQPWRARKDKENAIEINLCISCHDIDNDVTWKHVKDFNPFKEKWAKIAH